MLGSLTGGLQCQFLGRKKSLIIDNIVVFGSLVTLSFSHNYVILLICRFCLGVSVASLLVNVPSYTGEICQPKVRMLTGSFVMVCNSGGMSTMMVIGAMLNWRTAVQILAGFPILVIILVQYTQSFYFSKQLERYYPVNDILSDKTYSGRAYVRFQNNIY